MPVTKLSLIAPASFSARLSVYKSILAAFLPTIKSCENLQRLPFVHTPALKKAHSTDLGSVPGET